jgi:hypothetical protein
MSLVDRFEEIELDLDEDESVFDRIFLAVDVLEVIVFAFVLIIGTSSIVSMVTFLYLFEAELIMTGGYRPIYDLAMFGLLAAFGCLFFAICTLIYRSQNEVSLSAGMKEDDN